MGIEKGLSVKLGCSNFALMPRTQAVHVYFLSKARRMVIEKGRVIV